MSLVRTHNDCDPLEEIIVGRIEGARVPRPDVGVRSTRVSPSLTPRTFLEPVHLPLHG